MPTSLLDTSSLSSLTRPRPTIADTSRLGALRPVDTESNSRFDQITRLAAEFFKVPMAYVSFFEGDRQWFKSRVGTIPAETSRELSLCQYTLFQDEPLIINDALEHPIAREHPMVVGAPLLRFYAGVPLTGPRGQKIGTFCLLDLKPRDFGREQISRLAEFASIVEREINLSEIIQTQDDLLSTREALVQAQAKLKREFDDAAKYVRLMLPPPLDGPEIIDWEYLPSTQLGGDGLGYRQIDEDRIAFYALDVTGHGLGSALLAVTALELLRSREIRQLDFSRPREVIERLNSTFQMKDHAGKFFSVWYGVYSRSARTITYASAGHPPALLLTHENGLPGLTRTEPGGPVLGVMPKIDAPEFTIAFPKQSQLCLFTDGLYETIGPHKERGSYDEFVAYLKKQVEKAGLPLYDSMLGWLARAREQGSIDDDVTLLRFMTPR